MSTTKDINRPLLLCEIIPKICWGHNVRSHIKQSEWDKIRRWCYERAGHVCEICGDSGLNHGRKHAVEAHEIQDYDDINHSQTLVGLIALCPACHNVKHYGRAQIVGTDKSARIQLKKVNTHWSWKDVFAHCEESMKTYHERNNHEWTLNMDYLKTEFGLNIKIKRTKIESEQQDK